jgi:AraC family transcriptional regulator
MTPDRAIADALCGDRLAAFFPMVDRQQVRSVSSGAFGATRMLHEGTAQTSTTPSTPEEAFGVCLNLKGNRSDHALDGFWSDSSAAKEQTKIVDLQCKLVLRFHGAFDFIFFYMPRRGLRELAGEHGARRLDFSVAPAQVADDPVIAHLGAALLPALDRPHEANDLFIGHIALALQAHFLQTYLGRLQATRACRSGLTTRQLRIAKHMMQEDLTGNVSLDAIARECGISRSHFARAFAISVGRPPHQWLLDQRVNLARQLLGDSELSIGEIAVRCGFADQSHFTRVFSAKVGLTPGRWRRIRKQ